MRAKASSLVVCGPLGERSGADRSRLAPLEQAVGVHIAGNVLRPISRGEYADRRRYVCQVGAGLL